MSGPVGEPDAPNLIAAQDERDRRITCTIVLGACETAYNETKNPVFAWQAFHIARRSARPVPTWVMAYLDRVSSLMYAMVYSNIPQTDIPPKVYRALEFNPARRNNPFRTVTKANHDYLIAAEELFPQMRVAGAKLDGVIAAVAEKHPTVCGTSGRIADGLPRCESISRSTVARIWRKYGPPLMSAHADLTAWLDESDSSELSDLTDWLAKRSKDRRRLNVK